MPGVTYNNDEIESFIRTPKYLEHDPSSLTWDTRSIQLQAGTTATDGDNNVYRIIFRQNRRYPDSFSIILGIEQPDTGKLFRLRRYNGPGAQDHKNHIENETFHDYHIHEATERYQLLDKDPEHYAVKTQRFNDIESAFACMVEDCDLVYKNQSQLSLNIPVTS